MEQKKPVIIDYNDVVVQVENVSKSFGDLHVLRNVNLALLMERTSLFWVAQAPGNQF